MFNFRKVQNPTQIKIMENGIFYTALIFLGSLALGFFILRVSKMAPEKKKKARNFFWYAYAIFFFVNGGFKVYESYYNPIGYFYMGFGIVTAYYLYKGKLVDRMHL